MSQGQFWLKTLSLAIEDNPQDTWNHVSGYRTTAFCLSPYTRRRAVVSALYHITSFLRTIEQVLGLAPVNQSDASEAQMFDTFQSTPDVRHSVGRRPIQAPHWRVFGRTHKYRILLTNP